MRKKNKKSKNTKQIPLIERWASENPNYKKNTKRKLTPEELKEKEEMEKYIDDLLNDRL